MTREGVFGKGERRRRPRTAHLRRVPAFAGRTVGVGGNVDAWGRPFDRLRANGRASPPWVPAGAGTSRGGGECAG